MSRRAWCAVLLPLLVGVLVGCGSDEPPSAAAPELSDQLTVVDEALADRGFARAAKALDRLIAGAEEAEEAGRISAAEADEIIDAAENLAARLPGQADVDPLDEPVTPAPTETPAEDPAEIPAEEPGEGEEDEEGDEGDEGDEEKGKEKDEKKDQGRGNGKGKGD